MAYISTEVIKAIRTEIKSCLSTKDGFKLSVTREHYSTVRIVVLKSPLEFSSTCRDVNNYYLDNIENVDERNVFQIIDKIVERHAGVQKDRNAGDMGADYSDCNFYKTYKIGEWNKPCVFIN